MEKIIPKLFDSYRPSLIFPFEFLDHCSECNFKWEDIENSHESFMQWKESFTNYNTYTSIYLKYNDNIYVLGIFDYNKKLHISIYNQDGSITIIEFDVDTGSTVTHDQYIKIKNAILADIDGYFICNECGKQVRKEDKGGSYFAGRYCKDCWENKWKAIEKEETYN